MVSSAAAAKATTEANATAGDGSPRVVVCLRAEDLYQPAARPLIGSLCRPLLDQLAITPMELLHSARYQSRLDAAGYLLRDATEKAAGMQAKALGVSGAQRTRDLGELFVQFTLETRAIEEKEPAIPLKAGELAETLARLRASADPATATRRICRMLTDYLATGRVWNDKVDLIVNLVSEAMGTPEFSLFDQLLAEIIPSELGQNYIFGRRISLEHKIDDLVALYKNSYTVRGQAQMPQAAQLLTTLLGRHPFPETRAAIETAIAQLLASRNPLRSPELMMELNAAHGLANRMFHDKYIIGGRRCLEFLDRRVARLVNEETISDYVRGATSLGDRVLVLLGIYAITFGAGNRKLVESFLGRYFNGDDFERRLTSGEGSVQHKLKTLSQLYRAVASSPMSPELKQNYAGRLSQIQAGYIASAKLFALIEKQNLNSAQKMEQILALCLEGILIPGKNLDRGKALVHYYLNQPDFLEKYLSNANRQSNANGALAKLKQQLTSLGIPSPIPL